MAYQKKPVKFLALHFKLHGGEIVQKDRNGTLWRFPDQRTYLINETNLSTRKAQTWVAAIKDAYPYVGRNRLPQEVPRRSGRAPVLDFEQRQLSATNHAKDRFALMGEQGGLTWEEVDLALRAPIRVIYNDKHASWVWVGERVSVSLVERPGGYLITTLLWSSASLFDQFPRPRKETDD